MTRIQLGSNSRAKRPKMCALAGTPAASFQPPLPTPNTAKRLSRTPAPGAVDDGLSRNVTANNNDGSRNRRAGFQLPTD